tara:strand:- start:342 stop:653 length:312 start_codon:yes stop_codon:yes gene_type:complete
MRLTSKKKSDIREKTLKQMRNLQKKFEDEHPDLLDKIRREIGKQSLYDEDGFANVTGGEGGAKAELRIDRRKNLETVMQFAQNNERSPEFQKKLKAILLSVQH